jgi:hypothetical protein
MMLLAATSVFAGETNAPAVAPAGGGLAGAVDVWYRQVLELRNADMVRLEQQKQLQMLEAERDRLTAEKDLKLENQQRLDREIGALKEQMRAGKPDSPGLRISLVESELREADAPPRAIPPLTVVEDAPPGGSAAFSVRLDGRRYEATAADFAAEAELLAHLNAGAAKMEEEARRLEEALDRIAGEERAAWVSHIDRLRRRAETLRRTRSEAEAAFAAWRAHAAGGEAPPSAPGSSP